MNPLQNSPSGPFVPIARISMPSATPFVAGTPLAIPLSNIDYIKGDVGELITPQSGAEAFSIGPGLYFLFGAVELSAIPSTSSGLTIVCTSGSASDVGFSSQGGTGVGGAAMSASVCALRLAEETPINAEIFAAIGATFVGVGSSGNITKANLTIIQVGGFD